ncbi:MAG TPA: DUF5667 domain-containing protein [Candidatus Paceibacterota bacterium]|jgi:hypothetical protein|nr:DUF5667 domain-containing protein [Candidatus Paceibacterota bacterium]
MKQNKLQKEIEAGIEEVRRLKMTSLENARVLEGILSSEPPSGKSIQSPYGFYSFRLIFNKKYFIYSGSAICLVVILFSGAIFASAGSLPGSILYPLKVKVVEPARGAFITSPIAKVEYENDLATKRLVEAEILAYDGKLDTSTEEEINSLLENHTAAFNKAVDTFRKSESFDQSADDTVALNFQAAMNAHARVLEVIGENKSDKNNGSETREIKISKTARENASKIGLNLKDKEEQTSEKYKKRIVDVQAIIDKTSTDINDSNADTSSSKQRIIDGTNKTLDEARKLLKESDEDNNSGDSKGAYQKLRDSESSVKETSIFLKAGLELRGRGI